MLTALPAGSPRRIGPYQLLARVGAGGMGEVFLARRAEPGARLVALKAVRGDLDPDDAFRTRFRREIAAARAVSGPYTAPLVDGDADAEPPWLATEFVPGPSLADVVARCGPLPVPAVRALGAGLARALSAVHGARLLHRDLKPANVLLTADGPRLIDFGIAQAFEATALTATGVLVGTPGFLSPEQIDGSRSVVPASDVFSLGAVLCFAATGRGPFDDPELASMLFRVSRAQAELARVPAELLPLVERCLRLDPAARPTPDALADRLAPPTGLFPWPPAVLSLLAEHREAVAPYERQRATDDPASAPTESGLRVPHSPTAYDRPLPPPAPPTVPTRPLGRGPLRWVAAACAVAAGVTATVLLLPDGSGGTPPPAAAPTVSPTRSQQPAALPERTVMQYGNAGHSGEFGAQAAAKQSLPDGWRPWSVPRPAVLADPGEGCLLARATLVCADSGGSAAALDPATGRLRWSAPGPPGTPGAATAPPPETDGQRVYAAGELGVTALDLTSGQRRWRHRAPVTGAALSDGALYTVESGSTLSVRDAATGAERRRVRLPGPLRSPAGLLVRDGTVYVALADGGVVAYSARDGRRTAALPARRCDGLISHGDGILCWARSSVGVHVLDPGTLAHRRVIAQDRLVRTAPVVGDGGVLVVLTGPGLPRPDDRNRIAAYRFDSGRRLWDVPDRGDEQAALGLAGDRVITLWTYEAYTLTLDGNQDGTTLRSLPWAGDSDATTTGRTLGAPLFRGGAFFGWSPKGRLVSNRAL
ncbi:PQQ-binding-like beta-propeller repeat protein [Streptomyces sp. KL116D]|uniref:protein kinase domain-containing protein n=1 Tax=Streptomyces sp. KL116D TaxID=3045152 RepID=UPI00355879EB